MFDYNKKQLLTDKEENFTLWILVTVALTLIETM